MLIGIGCIECGGLLVLNEEATIALYDKKLFYRVADIGTVVEDEINKKLVFTCRKCNNEEHITYKEWEQRARNYLTNKLLGMRAAKLLTKYRAENVDETSGIEYCGGCFGYGGDGWCLKDIINQCELGKLKTNEL